MKNLTLKNITETCQGTYHGDPKYLDQEADGVVIDSRKVRPGLPLHSGGIYRSGAS